MAQLVQYGEVKRGMLGVQLANQFTPEIAESLGLENARGALVSQVVEGSAADKAGIKAGDVITSINGRNVANASELRNTIGLLRIGEKVELGLMREGKPRRVTAVIGERDGADGEGAAQIHPALEGAALANADGERASWCRPSPKAARPRRAACARTTSSSASAAIRVTNVEQLRAAVRRTPTAFAITIRRGNSTLVFPIGLTRHSRKRVRARAAHSVPPRACLFGIARASRSPS